MTEGHEAMIPRIGTDATLAKTAKRKRWLAHMEQHVVNRLPARASLTLETGLRYFVWTFIFYYSDNRVVLLGFDISPSKTPFMKAKATFIDGSGNRN